MNLLEQAAAVLKKYKTENREELGASRKSYKPKTKAREKSMVFSGPVKISVSEEY